MSSTCYKIPRLMMNIHCFGRNLATASCCLPPVQLPANKYDISYLSSRLSLDILGADYLVCCNAGKHIFGMFYLMR